MTYEEEIRKAKEVAAKLRSDLDTAWRKLGYKPERDKNGKLDFIGREDDWREVTEADLRNLIKESIWLLEYSSQSLFHLYGQTVRFNVDNNRITAKMETIL